MKRSSLFYFFFLLITLLNASFTWAQAETENFSLFENEFVNLTRERIGHIKDGSKPFMFSQHKKAPTVMLLHGLSDSPGSLIEIGQIYFKLGYNVVSVLLRDHGLLLPYREEARFKITLKDWREDIDKLLEIALRMSDTNQVAIAGYSLGGALALDATNRHKNMVSSLVFVSPLFKMNHSSLASLSKYLKFFIHSSKKGVPEAPHFYPDITLNQINYAYKLTKDLKKNVISNASFALKKIPKIMFLTDADTTIVNEFAYHAAKKINIPESNIVEFKNSSDKNLKILHRDLPMRIINASQLENQALDELLFRLEKFLIEAGDGNEF